MIVLKSNYLMAVLLLIFALFCTAEKSSQNKSLPQNEETKKTEQPQLVDEKSEIRNMKGTVVYQELEGGFWGIIADDGRKFNPLNLEDEFKKDSLRVQFDAKLKKGMVGIHMWGEYVNMLKIEKLSEIRTDEGDQ